MNQEEAKRRFGATWKSWKVIPVGAGWAFAVGIIEQGGRERVRVAKGKMKVAVAGELPITQAQKFNLKVKDWKELRSVIDDAIRELAGEEGVEGIQHFQPKTGDRIVAIELGEEPESKIPPHLQRVMGRK